MENSPNNSPNLSLITFDCYGTLIDWESGMKSALTELAEKKNLSIDIESLPKRYIEIELLIQWGGYMRYSEVLTLAVKKLFQENEIRLSTAEARIFADTITKWQPFEETKEVLTELKKKYKLAILSNIDDDIIEHSIRLIGVPFDGVITAEDVKSYKPAHNHWKRMMKVFKKIPKEEILHVAASFVHDIIPAKQQEYKAIWINRKDETPPQENIKPDYEFKDLRPLVNLLLK